MARELRLEHLLAEERVLFLALLAEPLLDLVLRARRLDDREPVERRPRAGFVDQDLDDVAVLELEVERDDLARSPSRRRSGCRRRCGLGRRSRAASPPAGSENTSPFGEKTKTCESNRSSLRFSMNMRESRMSFCHSSSDAQPGELLLEAVVLAAFFVAPVRRDAVLARAVHLERADLDLERIAARPDDRRVQRLVHVGLGHRDVVFEAARERLPDRVHDAERAVAVLDRVDDDADRGEVVDRREVAARSSSSCRSSRSVWAGR